MVPEYGQPLLLFAANGSFSAIRLKLLAQSIKKFLAGQVYAETGIVSEHHELYVQTHRTS